MKILPYTLKYSRIAEAVSKTDAEQLERYGCKIIDIIETDHYTIALIKMPDGSFPKSEYQLGFSKSGTDFTDYDQQWSKFPAENISLSNLAKVMPKIREWVDEYGPITVSSSAPRKMQTYYKIFKRFGFETTHLAPESDDIDRFGGAFNIS